MLGTRWNNRFYANAMFACLQLFFSAAAFTLFSAPLAPETSQARQSNAADRQDGGVTLSDLMKEGVPQGLILFYLNDKRDAYPSSPRVAVLSYNSPARRQKVQIFKTNHQKLVEEFAIETPPGSHWDEIESFPSNGLLPGIVIWSSGESTRWEATVICYADGNFRVVFNGQDIDLLDLDLDGIPEVIKPAFFFGKEGAPTLAQVWTWVDTKYVRIKDLPWNCVFSDEIVGILRDQKQKKHQ